jgi:hypothetical protein
MTWAADAEVVFAGAWAPRVVDMQIPKIVAAARFRVRIDVLLSTLGAILRLKGSREARAFLHWGILALVRQLPSRKLASFIPTSAWEDV